MATFTLAQAEAALQQAMDARTKILANGQAWSIGSRQLSRATLATVTADITFWAKQVRLAKRGGIPINYAIPIDETSSYGDRRRPFR